MRLTLRSNTHKRVNKTRNPYEFEPDTPPKCIDRMTTMSQFIDPPPARAEQHPLHSKRSHMRNSRSEGNVSYKSKAPEPLHLDTHNRSSYLFHHRRDSSPERSQSYRDNPATPARVVAYYEENPAKASRRRGQTSEGGHYYDSAGRSESPVRGRTTSHSPVKSLPDVIERDEVHVEIPESPVKRSRSPMKKMFGEGGWLGRTSSMDEFPDERYRKPGMMDKIKHKFEEFVRRHVVFATFLRTNNNNTG